MQLYVDESGNLGKKGRYFVIACLAPKNSKRIKNIIKKVFAKIINSTTNLSDVPDEIKGTLLSPEYKQEILTKLSQRKDFFCSYIVADLNHVKQELLQDKNILYNYLTQFLFKKLIYEAHEDIQIILDNHTTKVGSVHSLKDYIRTEAYAKWGVKNNITFEHKDSKDCKLLQCIDVMANVIYGRYSYNRLDLYGLIDKDSIQSIRFPRDKFGE